MTDDLFGFDGGLEAAFAEALDLDGAFGGASGAQKPAVLPATPAVRSQSSTAARKPPPAGPAPGVKVTLGGLVAKPELNGLTGKLIALNEATGRWDCRLDKGGKVTVKPANFTMMDRVEAKTKQGPAQARGPAAAGTAAATAALGASMASATLGTQESHSAGELPPTQGATVTLRNLVAKPELNGLIGRLVSLNKDTERWECRLADGGTVNVKPNNFTVDRVPPKRRSLATASAAVPTTDEQEGKRPRAVVGQVQGRGRGRGGAGGTAVTAAVSTAVVTPNASACRDAKGARDAKGVGRGAGRGVGRGGRGPPPTRRGGLPPLPSGVDDDVSD